MGAAQEAVRVELVQSGMRGDPMPLARRIVAVLNELAPAAPPAPAAAPPADPVKRPRPRLVYSTNGAIHVYDCRSIVGRTCVPFVLHGNSGDLARQVARDDLHPCRVCKPIQRIARWEKFG